MNLIVDRRLDFAERRLIQELTLKKRQSKKSHMSEKQVLARQQLADELMQVRKPGLVHTQSQCQLPDREFLASLKRPHLMRQSRSSASLMKHHQSSGLYLPGYHQNHQFLTQCCPCCLSSTSNINSNSIEGNQLLAEKCSKQQAFCGSSSPANISQCDTSSYRSHNNNMNSNNNNQHQNHNQHHRISSLGSSCSFSRSDSSYSASSHDSSCAHMHMILEQQQVTNNSNQQPLDHQNQQLDTTITLLETSAEADTSKTSGEEADDEKEASIKFNRSRLERLNEELEKRLYQYEYLVAQEKALLGTYNLVLFTSEGVNNFAY